MSTPAPLQFVPTLPPDDAARANFSALFARLFCEPPDEALLKLLASAEKIDSEEGGLGVAWRDLTAAAAGARAEAVRAEYDSLFIGTGKAPVTLYSCAYSMRSSNQAPLAVLRGELAALGLARQPQVNEPEDHIGSLCDTMRFLIAEHRAGLAEQKQFFERWIWPTAGALCTAIQGSDLSEFYRSVAACFLALCKVEHMAFEML